MSQLGIVTNPRFSGIFWTQFIGAFTDNLFKNALTLLVIFQGWSLGSMSPEHLTYLAGALFIGPFFICSATAGQLADKLEKSMMIRRLKQLEIFFSLMALAGLFSGNVMVLMTVLLFFALQAAFFGPIKYGILPELLDETELVAGNALVETATNIAILLGTIVAGLMIHRFPAPILGGVLVVISIIGYIASTFIPVVGSKAPNLRVEWNPIVPTWRMLVLLAEQRSIFNSVLGISWFWLLGGSIIAFFPIYTKDVLFANEEVETLLLAVFSIGVGVGSLWCEKLSNGRLELGLVPLGSIGISFFCVDLYLVGFPWSQQAALLGVEEFLHLGWPSARILCDLFLLATSSGFFIVPLYTLIQQRCRPEVRSRIIAGNNIVNALFMVSSYVALSLMRARGWTIPQIYGLLGTLNIAVAVYIYSLIPEFTLRFLAFLISHFMYRFKVVGEENIPTKGPVVLVCNHVSFVDWLIIAAAVRRPVHFVMWYTYYQLPVFSFIFRDAGCIPISNSHIRPKIMLRAFELISHYLQDDEVMCIFPEGRITKDGNLMEFRSGVEKIVAENPVPVVPMALRGLWGSNFSRYPGSFLGRFRNRPMRSHIELVIGEPIPPEQVKAAYLRERVLELRGDRA